MSTQVVLTLSDDLYERVQQWAAVTQRDVPHILADALDIALTPLLASPEEAQPVTSMSDAEVMALARVPMAPQQGKRLDHLLAKQREEKLTVQEQSELLALMHGYHRLWLRQSAALAEAVRRGLREPLAP